MGLVDTKLALTNLGRILRKKEPFLVVWVYRVIDAISSGHWDKAEKTLEGMRLLLESREEDSLAWTVKMLQKDLTKLRLPG